MEQMQMIDPQKWKHHQQYVKALQSQNQAYHVERQTLLKEFAHFQNLTQQMRNEIDSLVSQLKQLQGIIDDKHLQIQQLQIQLKSCLQIDAKQTQDMSNMAQIIRNLQTKQKSQSIQLNQLTQRTVVEKNELRKQFQIQIQQKANIINQKIDECELLQRNINQLNEEIYHLKEENSQLRITEAELRKSEDQWRLKFDRIQQNNGQRLQLVRNQRLQQSQQIQSKQFQIQSYKKSIQIKQSQLTKARQLINSKQLQLAELKQLIKVKQQEISAFKLGTKKFQSNYQKQIRSLKNQLEKLRIYQTQHQERKNQAVGYNKSLTEEINKLERELKRSKKENEEKQQLVVSLERKFQAMIDAKQRQWGQKEEQLKQKHSSIQNLQKTINALNIQLKNHQENMTFKDQSIKQKESQLAKLHNKLNSLQLNSSITIHQYKQLENLTSQQQVKLKECLQIIKEKQEITKRLQEKLDKTQAMARNQQAQLTALKKLMVDQLEEVQTLNSNFKALELTHNQSITNLQKQKSVQQNQLANLRKSLILTEKQLQDLRKSATSYQQSLLSQSTKFQQLKNEMIQKDIRLQSMERQLQRTKKYNQIITNESKSLNEQVNTLTQSTHLLKRQLISVMEEQSHARKELQLIRSIQKKSLSKVKSLGDFHKNLKPSSYYQSHIYSRNKSIIHRNGSNHEKNSKLNQGDTSYDENLNNISMPVTLHQPSKYYFYKAGQYEEILQPQPLNIESNQNSHETTFSPLNSPEDSAIMQGIPNSNEPKTKIKRHDSNCQIRKHTTNDQFYKKGSPSYINSRFVSKFASEDKQSANIRNVHPIFLLDDKKCENGETKKFVRILTKDRSLSNFNLVQH